MKEVFLHMFSDSFMMGDVAELNGRLIQALLTETNTGSPNLD